MTKHPPTVTKADRAKTHKMIAVSNANHAKIQALLLELMHISGDAKKTMDDVVTQLLEVKNA